jgi:AcrR family transcriptional regulator
LQRFGLAKTTIEDVAQAAELSRATIYRQFGAASRLILTSERMLAIGSEILRPMFEPARRAGLLQHDLELDALMEWVLRILMSYLAVPGPASRTEEDLRMLLRGLLLPAVLSK